MTIFIVEGAGEFPLDMLRFDRCWPASSNDAFNMQSVEGQNELREVRLEFTLMNMFDQRPTAARWQSFGWRVVAHAEAQPSAKAAKRELDHRGRR